MRNKLTTAVMVASVAVALTGGGVAIGASTHHGVTACSKNSNHALGLLQSGKCPKGSTKVTLGAQGPRGKRGKRGPGAIFDTMTVPNNDEQVAFPETIDGMTIATSCGMGSGVSISVGATTGSIDASGTGSADASVTPVDAFNAPSVGRTGVNQADLDIIASADSGPFARLDIHGTWANNACHYWFVSIPATQAPS